MGGRVNGMEMGLVGGEGVGIVWVVWLVKHALGEMMVMVPVEMGDGVLF